MTAPRTSAIGDAGGEYDADGVLFERAIAGMHDDWIGFFQRTELWEEARAILGRIAKGFRLSCCGGDSFARARIEDIICPRAEDIFAFARYELAPRVVILGQDPYPNRAHAHGLAFSVPRSVSPLPPSLRNIIAALDAQGLICANGSDAGEIKLIGARGGTPHATPPITQRSARCGNLEAWCAQGVILLNSALTTIEGKPGAHVAEWASFTQKIVRALSTEFPGTIFFLFGASAHKLKSSIARASSSLEWCHPSPLCASNRDTANPNHFIHCNLFVLANNILAREGRGAIDWSAPFRVAAAAAPGPVTMLEAWRTALEKEQAAVPAIIRGTLIQRVLAIDDDLVCPDDRAVYAFTDGAARRNGRAGATASYAAIVIDCAIVYQITGMVPEAPSANKLTIAPTNNRAELMALRDLFALMATEEFARDVHHDTRVVVVYDSAYAAGCVREWCDRWRAKPPRIMKANMDIIADANAFYKRVVMSRGVDWEKVKSHRAEPVRDDDEMAWFMWYGNKTVDELARDMISRAI